MLVELVMTVCLAGSGAQCHKEHLLLKSGGSVYHCLMRSPVHIARWSETHPSWRVTRWRCVPAGSETLDAI